MVNPRRRGMGLGFIDAPSVPEPGFGFGADANGANDGTAAPLEPAQYGGRAEPLEPAQPGGEAVELKRGWFAQYLKEQMDPNTESGRWERRNARSDGKPPALARGVDDPKRLDLYDQAYDDMDREYRRIPPQQYGEQWETPEAEAFRQRMREKWRQRGLSDDEIYSLFRYLRSLSD